MAAVREENCLQWLKTKCNVNIRRDWLVACIEFLEQENGQERLNSQLNDLVFEQLLMADFQEMSLGSLPSISGQLMMTIQGKHTLQINSIIDVGQSAYSQIQKMKGKDDPETLRENSSNKDTWEKKVKPSRMLYLQMTDGLQNIQAMEYQLIPCMRSDVLPGTKVQIQGPIDCRLGVLLLTAKNITILGGSVDELVETNCLWNMLHGAIGKEPPPLPAVVKREERTLCQEMASDNKQLLNEAQNKSNQQQSSNTTRSLTNNGLNYNSNVSSKQPQPSVTMKTKITDNVEYGNDYFDDKCNENFDFDQLDQIEQEVSQPKSGGNGLNQNSQNIELLDEAVFKDADVILIDDDMDDFDLDTSKNTPSLESAYAGSIKSCVQAEPTKIANAATSQNQTWAKFEQKCSSKVQDTNIVDFDVNSTKESQLCQSKSTIQQQKTISLKPLLGTAVNIQDMGVQPTAEVAMTTTNRMNNTVINSDLCKGASKSVKKRLKIGNILSHLMPKVEENEENKIQCKRIKLENNATSCGLLTTRPYRYLAEVIKDLPYQEDRTVRVKGYIATLVSHSQVSDMNQQWRVTVKINDGTESIDADLGEWVLTELLGCPLTSFQREMVDAKRSRDPLRCKALQQKTILFQQKLSMISCLMDLQFSVLQPRPIITGLIETCRNDIQRFLQNV